MEAMTEGFTTMGYQESHKLDCLHQFLTGEAKQFHRELKPEVKFDYFNLVSALHSEYYVENKDPNDIFETLKVNQDTDSVNKYKVKCFYAFRNSKVTDPIFKHHMFTWALTMTLELNWS